VGLTPAEMEASTGERLRDALTELRIDLSALVV
jgi:hypothetical protein